MSSNHDQNFDKLSHLFTRNIYQTLKGQLRLNILWRDFIEYIPEFETGSLSILDAGAGQGNIALQLAQKHHKLTLCDISSNMLEQARLLFARHNINDVKFIHAPVQRLNEHIDTQFDVVIFHAVLEWLAQPEQTLKQLLSFIRPGGYLSLMFYSRTGLIYQNLCHGNFKFVLHDNLAGNGKTLTPTNPQKPEDVYRWIDNADLKLLAKSGIRVFYDNISRERRKQINEDELFELEKRYSRIEPYCSLARYIHVLCQKHC